MRPVRHRLRAFHQVRVCVVIAARHSQVRSPNMCTLQHNVAGMPLVRVARHSSKSWVTRPKVKSRSNLQAARTLISQDQSRNRYATANGFIRGETPETDRRTEMAFRKDFFSFRDVVCNGNKTTKVCPNEPGGRARLFFSFLFFSFYLFHLIN